MYEYVKRNKTVLSSIQLAFSAKFPTKKREISLRWSTIDLINQRRRPNPIVAPREVSSGVGSLLLVVDFYYTMSRFFGKLHRDMNLVNVFAIHRCINEGYRSIQIFIEQIRITPHEIVACLHTDIQCRI